MRPVVRPELVARFKPWREVAAAALTAAFGLWVFAQGGLLFQPLGGAIARHHRCTGIAHQRGEPAGMVEMRLGAQDVFDVAGLEPELANIVEDSRRRLRQRAVDQVSARLREVVHPQRWSAPRPGTVVPVA